MKLEITPFTSLWMDNLYQKNIYNQGLNRLNLSGLKGSIRWWYEALIRGLGGYACDPTSGSACILKNGEALKKENPISHIQGQICPACFLFGCNGFASRFRLGGVFKITGEGLQKIEKGEPFYVQVHDRPVMPVTVQEKTLLDMVFKFISNHGSIGGRTVLKPSSQDNKNIEGYSVDGRVRNSHVNFGICDLKLTPTSCKQDGIMSFLESFKSWDGKENNSEHPDFKYIWFSSQILTRSDFNKVVGKQGYSHCYKQGATNEQKWLGGEKQASSKKIFSFHTVDAANGYTNLPRTWGYVKAEKGSRKQFETLLNQPGVSLKPEKIQWGDAYLKQRGLD